LKNRICKILIICLISLLIISQTGCDLTSYSTKKNDESSNTEELKIIDFKSPYGKLQVSAFNNWKVLDEVKKLNKNAVIGIGNLQQQKFAAIVPVAKSDLANDMTLKQYYDNLIITLKSNASNTVFSEESDLTVNGINGKLVTISGVVNDLQITYIYCIMDLKDRFAEVFVWCPTSSFDSNKEELLNVIKSIKEF